MTVAVKNPFNMHERRTPTERVQILTCDRLQRQVQHKDPPGQGDSSDDEFDSGFRQYLAERLDGLQQQVAYVLHENSECDRKIDDLFKNMTDDEKNFKDMIENMDKKFTDAMNLFIKNEEAMQYEKIFNEKLDTLHIEMHKCLTHNDLMHFVDTKFENMNQHFNESFIKPKIFNAEHIQVNIDDDTFNDATNNFRDDDILHVEDANDFTNDEILHGEATNDFTNNEILHDDATNDLILDDNLQTNEHGFMHANEHNFNDANEHNLQNEHMQNENFIDAMAEIDIQFADSI
jgi:hypothetical protein